MNYNYKTSGICAIRIGFDIEDNKVYNVKFLGGCDGNHKGIINLVEGMEVDTVIEKLSGITCGPRNTSCPDQLAKALASYKNGEL